jgi:hypothetical protein
MEKRRINWRIWAGFLTCIAGLLSYFLVFSKFPVTRDVPWVNFLLLSVGIALLGSGLRRAFKEPLQYRGKIVGSILTVLSLAGAGFFCFLIFYASKQLPKSAGAPRVGDRAPEFALADTRGEEVSLSSLMTSPLPDSKVPPKGALLIFYRGYW